ncbi:MAG TPA: hypothetical protein VNG89_27115 [Vicinamibacterales bacterium]|nr:hypothetical protein [Vicinamibacterales bacterium]
MQGRMQSAAALAAIMLIGGALRVAHVSADAVTCNTQAYTASPGLTAACTATDVTLTWSGQKTDELRMRLTIANGTPTIADISIRKTDGTAKWASVASNLTPEYRVVSGWRRLDREAYPELVEQFGTVTQALLDKYKWDAFWDAPLRIPGGEVAHGGATPPPDGIAGTNQPGLPRKPEEVKRATASFKAQAAEIKTDGGRIEVTFPGVEMGIFAGRLQYTVYKGTNLIRQEVIAKTDQQSVAYKYDAGVKGLAIKPTTRVVWRDTSNNWQESALEAGVNTNPAVAVSANRLLAAQAGAGSLTVFPPPHKFFWVREIPSNLGYTWFRKDSASSYSIGIRQAESEMDPAFSGHGAEDTRQNFALYNARPGTWQHMPMYLLVGSGTAKAGVDAALAYTRSDHYKPLPGYLVMARHFHTSPVSRLLGSGALDNVLDDFQLARTTGVNVYEPVGGGGVVPTGAQAFGPRQPAAAAPGAPRPAGPDDETRLKGQALYYEMAKLQARKNFFVLPTEEIFNIAGAKEQLGGHNDLLPSHPVYFVNRRSEGQPLVESHPTYGQVYHLGSPADFVEMAHRENMLFFMPHPNTKSSAGYPESIKDKPFFRDQAFGGVGFRWGMGLDQSEERLCDYRCMPVFDAMNNWTADLPTPPKYMTAIAETYVNRVGDDFYANTPVTYLRPDGQLTGDNWAPIVNSLKKGTFFVTSGEVLITSYDVKGTGRQRTISADVEWTFPLEFAEVVWGDGVKTERQIIRVTDLPAFGTHHFDLPFDPTGKKWVRFAVWDSAGNGAFVQPIKLTGGPTTTTASGR